MAYCAVFTDNNKLQVFVLPTVEDVQAECSFVNSQLPRPTVEFMPLERLLDSLPDGTSSDVLATDLEDGCFYVATFWLPEKEGEDTCTR